MPWSIDVPGGAGHEQWGKKRETLDMVPVRVGDHEMSVAARPGGQQRWPNPWAPVPQSRTISVPSSPRTSTHDVLPP